DDAQLRAGMKLLVPRARAAALVAPAPAPARSQDPELPDPETSPDDLVLVAVPERANLPKGLDRVFYRVVVGDTPREIASGLKVAAEDLCEWNDLDLHATLQTGMILQAFVPKTLDRSGVVLLDGSHLRVASVTSPEFNELAAQQRG